MYGKIYDMQDECRTQETGCTGNRNQMIEKEKKMLRQLSVFALLGICGMEDWKTKRIHIGWLLFFAAEGFLCSVCFWKRPFLEIAMAVIPGIMIYILSNVLQGGIGEGDGLLLLVTGLFLNASAVFGIFMHAVFLAALAGLFLYIFKKKSRKYEMPFVPFLFLAFLSEILLERAFG